jgi:hypothetical protein
MRLFFFFLSLSLDLILLILCVRPLLGWGGHPLLLACAGSMPQLDNVSNQPRQGPLLRSAP